MDEQSLKQLAKLFLKLGVIGFGGPAVHIAMMEKEVVRKRKWMSHEHFLDLVGATNLIPGPNSTEMTMHIGRERAGWKGLVVAGLCFILPAVIITSLFAWGYKSYGTLPDVKRFIYGIKPAIIAVVISLTITLAAKALKNIGLWIVAALSLVLALTGINEIYVLFGAGLMGMIWQLSRNRGFFSIMLPFTFLQINGIGFNTAQWNVFWIFLKVGAILYGSGYVLFSFLNAELVEKGLLTRDVLVDAIAVGQFTPGPVFSSATFIGWQMAGPAGALAATIGIFLPAFIFVALLNPMIATLRKSSVMSAFLDFVNAASVALIAAICIELGRASVSDWRTILIALLSFAATFLFKNLNTAFIILGGAVLGYILTFL